MGIINCFKNRMDKKNRFAGAMAADSDDDVQQKVTKVQEKKEERKITEKAPIKMKAPDAKGLEAEGFSLNEKRAPAQRGGRGGGFHGQEERGGRGGRGGRGRGDRKDGDKPREFKPRRTDAEGNLIGDKPYRPRTAKVDGEHPQGDRKDGTGQRDRKPYEGKNKRDGEGRGRGGGQYKKKREDGEEEKKEGQEPVVEEKKEREPPAPKTRVETEVIGQSLDDFLGGASKRLGAAEARKAEGLKGVKSKANDVEKVHQN